MLPSVHSSDVMCLLISRQAPYVGVFPPSFLYFNICVVLQTVSTHSQICGTFHIKLICGGENFVLHSFSFVWKHWKSLTVIDHLA